MAPCLTNLSESLNIGDKLLIKNIIIFDQVFDTVTDMLYTGFAS